MPGHDTIAKAQHIKSRRGISAIGTTIIMVRYAFFAVKQCKYILITCSRCVIVFALMCLPNPQLFNSFFKTMVGKVVTVELKNDLRWVFNKIKTAIVKITV